MRAERTGALEYCGVANVDVIGQRKGSVNYYEFDSIASVVETSGFLEISENDDGDCVTTGGNTTIGVEFTDGLKRVFTRDGMNEPPIFWAVAKLLGFLLAKVRWGDSEYEQAAIEFTSRDDH